MKPRHRRQQAGTGAAFLAAGLTFLVLGLSGDRTAYVAVGLALLVLGVVLLGSARRRGQP